MKKLLVGILTAGLVLSVVTTSVLATGQEQKRKFADTNSDGICDYAGENCLYADQDSTNQGSGQNFVDEDNDGVCDNFDPDKDNGNQASGSGQNFVDEDNDGICDNFDSSTGLCNGLGQKNRFCGNRSK